MSITASLVRGHACPVCSATAGWPCRIVYVDDFKFVDDQCFHSARIALATPQPTDLQRFAERLAEKLCERANQLIRMPSGAHGDTALSLFEVAGSCAKRRRRRCDLP